MKTISASKVSTHLQKELEKNVTAGTNQENKYAIDEVINNIEMFSGQELDPGNDPVSVGKLRQEYWLDPIHIEDEYAKDAGIDPNSDSFIDALGQARETAVNVLDTYDQDALLN